MDVRPCATGDLVVLDELLPLAGQYGHSYRLDEQARGRWLYLLALDPTPVGGCLVQWAGPVNDDVRRQVPDAVEITNLYVDAHVRGRGAGRMLITEAERQAAARGREMIGVGVSDDNPEARRLYERLGYSLSGARYKVAYDYVDEGGVGGHAVEEGDFLVKTIAAP